jgi:hypothetical protein
MRSPNLVYPSIEKGVADERYSHYTNRYLVQKKLQSLKLSNNNLIRI